ncbi:MAG: ABC transporter permease [Phycisphaeraceae bacterium]
MKPIEARQQVKLGPRRCFQLALSGMSYRLFRSMITVAILALAVAFLVHMLAYGLMAHEAELQAARELRDSRSLGRVITRVTSPDATAAIVEHLAAGDEQRLAEYRAWSGLDEAAFAQVVDAAHARAAARAHLTALPLAQRIRLVGEVEPDRLFDRLRDPEQWARFEADAEQLGIRPPLDDMAAFRRLIDEQRPVLSDAAGRIHRGHRRAINALAEAYPDLPPRALFTEQPEGLGTMLRELGYAVDEQGLDAVGRFAERASHMDELSELMAEPNVRAAVARRLNISPGDVTFDDTMHYVAGGRGDWFAGVLRDAGARPALTDKAHVDSLAEAYRREKRLDAVVTNIDIQPRQGLFGLPAQTMWLIGLSFMVCVVGVANAMLMSVTERFTEIATMKCLGAMDAFVMMMFVFEAVIQGLVGGLIGVVLGMLLALLRGVVEYGGLLGGATPVLDEVAIAATLSLVTGVTLAAVAAIGPAWVAARLAPMEAMRVE